MAQRLALWHRCSLSKRKALLTWLWTVPRDLHASAPQRPQTPLPLCMKPSPAEVILPFSSFWEHSLKAKKVLVFLERPLVLPAHGFSTLGWFLKTISPSVTWKGCMRLLLSRVPHTLSHSSIMRVSSDPCDIFWGWRDAGKPGACLNFHLTS